MFAIPTFLFVREPKNESKSSSTLIVTIKKSYLELGQTFGNLRKYRDLARFLLSFFFFQGGLAIVISFAALYGKQVIGIEGKWQTIFFVGLQLTAAAGAFTFGFLQDKIGALRSVNITLVIWIATIVAIYFVKPMAEYFNNMDPKLLFVIVGNFAGFCLGATQSSARALVGMFSPPDRSGEFYGFWGFSGKMAAVSATLAFGFMQRIFSLENAMLMCSLFFIVGFILNLGVNEKRGREAAL